MNDQEYKKHRHCVKSVPTQSYFWSVFSYFRTEYGPDTSPYLDTFYALRVISKENAVEMRSHLRVGNSTFNGQKQIRISQRYSNFRS